MSFSMIYQKLLRDGVFLLSRSGIPSASLDARLLLEHASGFDRTALMLKSQDDVPFDIEDIFKTLIQMRLKRIPVAKIIGTKEFWSLPFKTTKATLDPRPDSEVLIEAALRHYRDKTAALRIVDFGTGTGCLLLSLLSEYQNATGVGVDYSKEALAVAAENAQNLALSNRAHFLYSNWGQDVAGQFDLLISNPPYIAWSEKAQLEPELAFDPEQALFAEQEGLGAYITLAEQMRAFMTADAKIVLEIGHTQEQQVKQIFHQAQYCYVETIFDLAGRSRGLVFTG
jgi:protein-(glutamine-N5) methyltransferase, release factor-specific